MPSPVRFWLLFVVGASSDQCDSSHDCGLLGECNAATRTCTCDPGWTSPNCTKLDFLPAGWGPSRQAYMNNESSWGGNIVKGGDGLYHLFFSEMRRDGLHQYQYNSQASHAVSTSPMGPFQKKEVIRGPMSHNVQPQIGPDGAIYIFMISGEASSQEPHGPLMVGRALDANAKWDWLLPEMLYMNGTRLAPDVEVDNPTAIMYNNGTVLLMVRSSALYTASSWRGPFIQVSEDVLGCGGRNKVCSIEDPFIWQSPRGLHLIAHDHEPFEYHKQVTAYAFTEDLSGRSGWTFSGWPAAEARSIQFDDGSTHTFCSQQRPQLYFSELPKDGVQHGVPLILFTGVQHGALTEKTEECGLSNQNVTEYNPYLDYSFTMAQPLSGGASRLIVV